ELRLLRCQRNAGGLRVEPELPRTLVLGAVPFAHPSCPDPASGAKFGNLLEEIYVRVEEEREPRCEVVDAHASLDAGVDVRHAVREREGELLRRGRAPP